MTHSRDRPKLRASRTALAALIGVVVAACGHTGGEPPRQGSVDIGNGRTLFLDCQGSGSPTVFIIPGKGSYAEVWNVVVPQDDPIRSSPYDIIEQAKLTPSQDATQPLVAKTNRVCSYDRPNTRPDGTERSSPVGQPHSLQDDVDDVVALIAAAHLTGPLVVVAHSYGGLIADLLTRDHPELVSALVLVDPVSEFLPDVGSAAQNAAFNRDGQIPAGPDGEGVLFEDAFNRIHAGPAWPNIPAAVLSSGKFPLPDQLTPENYTQAQIHRANDMLAAALHTTNRIVADSGHNVMLYAPRVVSDTIGEMAAQTG